MQIRGARTNNNLALPPRTSLRHIMTTRRCTVSEANRRSGGRFPLPISHEFHHHFLYYHKIIMLKHLSILSLTVTLSAIILSACDDDSDKSSQNETPSVCTQKCQNESTLIECIDNAPSEKHCDFGCKNDACNPKPETPVTCSQKCINQNTLLVCNNDGTPSESPCPFGCKNDACNDVSMILGTACAPEDSPFCVDNALVYCAENLDQSTTWTKMGCPSNYTCAVFDDQAMCLAKCDQIGSKSASCGQSILVETSCTDLDGKRVNVPNYANARTCNYGCASATACSDTDYCDADFKESCFGETRIITCNQGMISDTYCSSDKSCFFSPNGQAKCGIKCDPKTAGSHLCYENSGHYAWASVTCLEGDTGFYGYNINSYEYCAAVCNDLGLTESGCNDLTGCICN